MEVSSRPILLLDLDGVVVLEPRSADKTREILVLHQHLGSMLAAARQTTVIVTHRSRREARQILRAMSLAAGSFVRLIGAEDLLNQACAGLHLRQLVRGGLQKNLALSLVEKITGQGRDNIVMLDDRQRNLDIMISAGVGLALKAPSDLSSDGRTVTTFDMVEVLQLLPDWHAHRSTRRQRDLRAVQQLVAPWQKSGLSTASLESHAFNRARRIFYITRRYLSRSSA